MALNSVSERALREYWERAQSIGQVYADYASQKAVDGLTGCLQWINSGLQLALNTEMDSNERQKIFQEKTRKIRGTAIPIETQFRQLLARQINSGRKVAIGLRSYGSNRAEYRIVWDGKIQFANLNFETAEYSGPNFHFSDIRILSAADCDEELLRKFDRLRGGKKGRPEYVSIPTAIERVFLRNASLDNPALIKRASAEIILEISRMRNAGATHEEPEESTIQSALRKRWKK